MGKKDYHNWSKEQLVHEIKQLLKRKKFGLVWEDKPEEAAQKCKEFLPVLKEIKKKQIISEQNDPMNILIEGDNYHALSVLSYTHKKKIDVIYIDPPYNTGNKSWKYNNNYVEKDDRFRHSKWLSFIEKRLRLARNLLKDSGIILVTIDDHEVHTLRHLMDEFFGEKNRLGTIAIVNKIEGRTDDKFIPTAHEYMLVYARNADYARINELPIYDDEIYERFPYEDEISRYQLKELRRGGANSRRVDRPNLFYPIYYNPAENRILLEKETNEFIEILPIDNNGIERCWRWGKERLIENQTEVVVTENSNNSGRYDVKVKAREISVRKVTTVWSSPKYNAATHGTKLLTKILGKRGAFDYPKSIYSTLDSLAISSDRESIILDFFAGSGTTGHAVLELNKQDGGARQFILCTNNEDNNGDGTKIANDICYPRIKNVIKGYSHKGKKVAGLGGNLRYYQTDFVEQVRTDNDKRVLVSRSTEMLCLAESTFEEVLARKGAFALYENKEQMTGIIYDEDVIDDFKKAIKKFRKPLVVYVFSYDHTYNEEDFAGIPNLIKVKPIPEAILNIYRKIYKRLRKTKRL